MKSTPILPTLAGVAAALWLSAAASAQQAEEPLVITVTKVPTPLEEVAGSVSLVTRRDIEQRQQRTVADTLRDIPGLSQSQSGGLGAFSNVFLRGTNANHTKVLIDGMPANDPGTFNGAFDFGSLLADDVERIEVLRGPQSGLYGSDAIGGVVNIVTREGGEPPRLAGSIEGGSFDTFNQLASIAGSAAKLRFAVSAAHLSSGDTPVTPLNLLPPGRARIGDAFEATKVSTKLGADIGEAAGVSLVARYSETTQRFTADDFSVFPSIADAAQSTADNRQLLTRGEGRLALFGGVFEQRLGLGYIDYRSRFEAAQTALGPAAPTITRSGRTRVDWLGTIHAAPQQTVVAGLEYEREALRDSPTSEANGNCAGFIELQSGFLDRLSTTATVRVDDNDRFGGVATYRLAAAYQLRETATKLHGSYGTAFKAPSLTQLFVDAPVFNFFANPNLQPEESRGWEAGAEQRLVGNRLLLGATWFQNRIDDLITTNAASTTFENRPKAETYGVEAFARMQILDNLSVKADYTWTIAEDTELDQALLRRPKHKASLVAAWQPVDDTTLTFSALHVGKRVDGNRDFSIPRLEASAYTIFSLAGSYSLTERIAAFARLENLLDKRYEDPTGFERPGLGVFVGLRVAVDGNSLAR